MYVAKKDLLLSNFSNCNFPIQLQSCKILFLHFFFFLKFSMGLRFIQIVDFQLKLSSITNRNLLLVLFTIMCL